MTANSTDLEVTYKEKTPEDWFNALNSEFKAAIINYSDKRTRFFKLWKSLGGNAFQHSEKQMQILSTFSSEESKVFHNDTLIAMWKNFMDPFQHYGSLSHEYFNNEYPDMIETLNKYTTHMENMLKKLMPNIQGNVEQILTQTA